MGAERAQSDFVRTALAAVLKSDRRGQRESRQTEDPGGPRAGKDGDGWSRLEVGRREESSTGLKAEPRVLPAGTGVG